AEAFLSLGYMDAGLGIGFFAAQPETDTPSFFSELRAFNLLRNSCGSGSAGNGFKKNERATGSQCNICSLFPRDSLLVSEQFFPCSLTQLFSFGNGFKVCCTGLCIKKDLCQNKRCFFIAGKHFQSPKPLAALGLL